MWQSLITYLIVAGAAGWVVWSLFLPASLRATLRSRASRALGQAGSAARPADGCGCARDPR